MKPRGPAETAGPKPRTTVYHQPARTAAELVNVNRNTAILFYHRLREIITNRVQDDSPIHGVVELDESYFGGVRKGRRGRGAAGKVPVFGILKRGGQVYTTMIPNARALTLLSIVQDKVELIRWSTPTRSAGEVRAQPERALCAASSARSTSCASERGTSHTTSPFIGETLPR
jgi:transposase-like protein